MGSNLAVSIRIDQIIPFLRISYYRKLKGNPLQYCLELPQILKLPSKSGMVKCIMAYHAIQEKSDNRICAYMKEYPICIVKFKSKL